MKKINNIFFLMKESLSNSINENGKEMGEGRKCKYKLLIERSKLSKPLQFVTKRY